MSSLKLGESAGIKFYLVYSYIPMVVYHCLRCGKKQSQKSHWRTHLRRKRPCEAKFLDIDGEEIIEDYDDLLPEYMELVEDKKKIYRCDKCPFKSAHKRSYTRHKKESKCGTLAVNNEIELLKLRLQLLESQVQAPSINIGEINIDSHPTIVNGDVNNYHLTGFGNENISGITIDQICDVVATNLNAVPNLNKLIRSRPENMNLYVQNVRSNYMKVFNGESWELMDKMTVIEESVRNTIDLLQDLIKDHREAIPNNDYRKVNRTLDSGEQNSTDPLKIMRRQEFNNNLKKYIKQMETDLINMRNMVRCNYEQGTGQKIVSRGA